MPTVSIVLKKANSTWVSMEGSNEKNAVCSIFLRFGTKIVESSFTPSKTHSSRNYSNKLFDKTADPLAWFPSCSDDDHDERRLTARSRKDRRIFWASVAGM